MSKQKELHDAVLALMPEGASHEPCALCQETSSAEAGGGNVTTYTADEVQAQVDEATSALKARIAAMEAAAAESETESKIVAAKAAAEAEVAEVREQLDTAVLEAQKSKNELEATLAYLTDLAVAEAAAVEAASRKDERLARIKEVASFPDEYLEANADRYAAMTDEAFEERISEWASLAPKAPVSDGVPAKTGLSTTRESAGKEDNGLSIIGESYKSRLNFQAL